MPLDSSIPLSVKPFQAPDILGQFGQLASLKQLGQQNRISQIQLQNAEQSTKDAQAIRSAIQQGGGDLKKTRELIAQLPGAQGMLDIIAHLDQQIGALDFQKQKQVELEAENGKKKADAESEDAMRVYGAPEESRDGVAAQVWANHPDWPKLETLQPGQLDEFLYYKARSGAVFDLTSKIAKEKREAAQEARSIAGEERNVAKEIREQKKFDAEQAQTAAGGPPITAYQQAQLALQKRGQDITASKEPKEPLVAIIGPDGKSVLVPRSQAEGKQPANAREQGRPVISGDANRLGDMGISLIDLDTLRKTIPAGSTGAAAQLGALLPNAVSEATGLGIEAKKKQAVIARVKQIIGKALEGGVLRKEDEIKYKDILPTIGDPAPVVKAKLDGLERMIQQKRETLIDSLDDANYDVSKYRTRTGTTPAVPAGQWRIIP